MSTEALKLALEALEFNQAKWRGKAEALTAIKEALAQPQQEPIGYLWPTGMHPEFRYTQQKRDGVDGTPVYLSPPQRKPLTDEEIRHIKPISPDFVDFRSGVRCAERAHGIGDKA